LSSALAADLGGIEAGDLLYISDPRAWLGGLRSAHAAAGEVVDDELKWVEVSEHMNRLIGSKTVRIRAFY
jgi:hypothetical protein